MAWINGRFEPERMTVTTLELLELIEQKKLTTRIFANDTLEFEVPLSKSYFKKHVMSRFGSITEWSIILREDDILFNFHVEMNHLISIRNKEFENKA